MSSTTPAPRGKSSPPRVTPTPRRRRGRFWLLVLCVSLPLCAIVSVVSYSLVSNFLGAGFSTGGAPIGGSRARSASAVATDFMEALKARNSAQAYGDLASTLLVAMTPSDFARQAERADVCFGAITDYALAEQGAGQFTYAVRRAGLAKAYPLQLRLQTDSPGSRAITDFGPGQTLDPPGAGPASSCPASR